MKIYIHERGIVLAGKKWEVLQKLKEYSKLYSSVAEWISNDRLESAKITDFETYRSKILQK